MSKDTKWRAVPIGLKETEEAVRKLRCVVCTSDMLVAILRGPNIPGRPWLAHCNCCGSEVTVAAMINRDAWVASAHYTPKPFLDYQPAKCAGS